MKNLCFCLNLHIPPPMFYYRFFNIQQNQLSLSCPEIDEYYKKICQNRLLSFLKLLNKIMSESEGKLKIAVTISGNTLIYLKNYTPETLKIIAALIAKRQIVLFSEPYHHSLISYKTVNSFLNETEAHEELLKKLLHYKSEAFILHSGLNSAELIKSIVETDERATIICPAEINIENELLIQKQKEAKYDSPNIFAVNQKLSNLIHRGVYGIDEKSIESSSTSLFFKFMKHFPQSEPAVVVYNPLHLGPNYQLTADSIFGSFLKKLLANSEIAFLPPVQLSNYGPTSNNAYSLIQKIPKEKSNIYMENKLQKTAFKYLIKVQKFALQIPQNLWDVVKDMEYLRYMSLTFTTSSFAKRYFNPYSSPYLAYISYMNVLESIWVKQQKDTGHSTKRKSFTDTYKYLEN